MIKFLYKILHYELSYNKEDDIRRTFYFILLLTVALPASIPYLIYLKIGYKSLILDIICLSIQLSIAGYIYYLVCVKEAKRYVESKEYIPYYNFSKLNLPIKTLFFLLGVGIIVLVGRLIIYLIS